MGVFDQTARHVIKMNPQGFLAWALGPDPQLRFVQWLDTETLSFPGEPRRICDTVALCEAAGVALALFVLVIESQSEPDPDMLERLLEYLIRLRRERRHGP